MRKLSVWGGITLAAVVWSTAQAGLIDQFDSFTYVEEVGVSGLRSSYHADTVANQSVLGPLTGSSLHALSANRVHYANQGTVPSGGPAYDYGALGIRVSGSNLIVRVANGINPLTGRQTNDTTYGAGDAFLTISDSNGVRQYAALNTWARDDQNNPIAIGDGHFNDARDFHVSGGAGGTSLEGHLIRFSANNQVRRTGGPHGHSASNAPDGLDLRAFSRGGIDLGSANLVHSSVVDGQTWYIQTWTIPLALLSSDSEFGIGVHATQSCGNDQIGLTARIPEPASFLLVSGGMLLALARRRNPA